MMSENRDSGRIPSRTAIGCATGLRGPMTISITSHRHRNHLPTPPDCFKKLQNYVVEGPVEMLQISLNPHGINDIHKKVCFWWVGGISRKITIFTAKGLHS